MKIRKKKYATQEQINKVKELVEGGSQIRQACETVGVSYWLLFRDGYAQKIMKEKRNEKGKIACELYKSDYTVSQISKKVHMTYVQVRNILVREKILKPRKINKMNFDSVAMICKSWAYHLTELYCIEHPSARDYFNEIWLAKTIFLIDEFRKAEEGGRR